MTSKETASDLLPTPKEAIARIEDLTQPLTDDDGMLILSAAVNATIQPPMPILAALVERIQKLEKSELSAEEPNVGTDTRDLRAVLDRISMRPSCVDFGWIFEIQEVTQRGFGGFPDFIGWHIRVSFCRPDTNTGEVGAGFGRWEFVPAKASISSVVKTAWLCIEMVTRHELMEAFCFDGMRVFDPHKKLSLLTMSDRE